MHTEISFLSISSKSSTDAVAFWTFSAEREYLLTFVHYFENYLYK